MNKKFMSFVLAMVLSVGLGSGVLFATDYDASGSYQGVNEHTYSWTETTSSSTASNQTGSVSSELTGNGFLIKFGSAEDRLSGNLSGIFSYYAGSMIGYQQAGGTYYLYDSYGMRGVLASSVGSGSFTLESWTWRTSDLADLEKCETVADYERLMKQKGFSGETLRRMAFDEQGNPKGTVYTEMGINDPSKVTEITEDEYKKQANTDKFYYYTKKVGKGDEEKTVYCKVEKSAVEEKQAGKHYDEEWTNVTIGDNGIEYQSMNLGLFELLKDTLRQGKNFTATLSMGDGATGMSVTVSENGKQKATYVSYDKVKGDGFNGTKSPFGNGKVYNDIRCSSEVLYNEDGLQIGTKSYSFEFDSTTANSGERQVGVGGHWVANYTYINFDDVTGNRFDTTFNKVSIDKKDAGQFTTAMDGKTVTGSINDPATRANVRMANSVMEYSSNGSRFRQINNEKNEKTYFADNMMSITYNKENTVIAKIGYTENHVQEKIWQSDNTADQAGDGDKGGTTSFCDYNGTVVGVFSDTNATLFNGSHASAQAMVNVANAYKRSLISGVGIGNVGALQSVNWYEKELKQIAAIPKSQRSAAINKIFDSKSITTGLNFSNGIATVASTSIADSTWDENLPSEGVESDDAKVTSKETKKVNGGTVIKGGSFPSYERLKSSKTEVVGGRGYSLTTTINAGGSAAFQTKCDIITQKFELTTNTYETVKDPAIEGNIVTDQKQLEDIAASFGVDPSDVTIEDGVITIKNADGSTTSYVAIEAASINIMDGSGFQSANGEVVIVQLNGKDSKGNEIKGLSQEEIDALKSNIAKGETKAIFMGNVRDNLGGKKAITIDTGYDDGFKLGASAVQAEKDKIFLASLAAAVENGMDVQKASDALTKYNAENSAANGKNYTMADAESELAKAKENPDDEWIINNTKDNMQYFDKQQKEYNEGWEVLRQLAVNF